MSAAPVLCVGAALWDIIARAEAGLAPGADVPGRIARQPGGVALNIALALAGMGRPVGLLAAVGRDGAGADLLKLAEARGVDCAGVTRHDGATDSYLAIEDPAGEVFAAVADCAGLERIGAAVLGPLRARPPAGRVVVDGNLPEAVLAEIAALTDGARLAIVPASPGKAGRLRELRRHPRTTLYLNRGEAEVILGRRFSDSRAAAAALIADGLGEVVVTDGAAAVTVMNGREMNGGGAISLTPPPVTTRSLTGAGDRFLAAHLAACDDGLDPESALWAAIEASARHISTEVT